MEIKESSSESTSLKSMEKHETTPSVRSLDGSSTPSSNTNEKAEQQADDQNVQLQTVYPTRGIKFWLIILSLTLVVILGGLDFAIIGVAVPSITQHFHTIADVGWYNVSYRLTACAFQFAFGQLYDHLPLRWVFSSAIVIFLFGSALSAAAVSSTMFVVGRAITGVGSSGILGGIFVTLVAIAPLRLRPILTSLTSGLEAVAMVVSPIIGGVLTQKVSWRWCFYINLPIGGLTLAFLTVFLPTSRGSTDKPLPWLELLRKLDLIGNAIFIAALTCLFMALSWGGSKFAWSSAPIIVLLVLFGVLTLVWLFIQYRRGDEASLPGRVLKQRSVAASALFSFCLNGSMGVLEYYLPIYFQVVRGYSPAKAGYMVLPITVGFNIALILQGACTTLVGFYAPFAIASSIFLSVGAGLMTTWTIHSNLAALIIFQGLFGFGCGLAFEVPQIAVQTVLPESDTGLGLSVTLFAQNFGGALFISVAQQIFTKELLRNLQGKIPGLNASNVQDLGLIDIPGLAGDGASSGEVVQGLSDAFIQTWYIAVALACITIVGSLALEWRSVKGDGEEKEEEGNNEVESEK